MPLARDYTYFSSVEALGFPPIDRKRNREERTWGGKPKLRLSCSRDNGLLIEERK